MEGDCEQATSASRFAEDACIANSKGIIADMSSSEKDHLNSKRLTLEVVVLQWIQSDKPQNL